MSKEPHDQPTDFASLGKIMKHDQRMAAMAPLAGIIFSHFAAMKAAGFTPQEALYMTANYQSALIGKHKS